VTSSTSTIFCEASFLAVTGTLHLTRALALIVASLLEHFDANPYHLHFTYLKRLASLSAIDDSLLPDFW
jgi:hypothetical protein